MKVALTIAGSDSGGGAGIQADLAAFRNMGVWGTCAITCLTAQNPDEVTRVDSTDPAMVAEQIRVVCKKFPVAAVKIGMTYSAPIIEAIAEILTAVAKGVPVVLDPVMRATSGAKLLGPGGEESIVEKLLPMAAVVTPNLAEACVLSGMEEINTIEQMKLAGTKIAGKTNGSVLVKGGHLDGAATDVLYAGGEHVLFQTERINSPGTHGTGCSLSSAIAAGLAKGLDLNVAIQDAKDYITAILKSPTRIGDGEFYSLGFVNPVFEK